MPRTLPRWLDGAALYFRIMRLRPEFVGRRENPITANVCLVFDHAPRVARKSNSDCRSVPVPRGAAPSSSLTLPIRFSQYVGNSYQTAPATSHPANATKRISPRLNPKLSTPN